MQIMPTLTSITDQSAAVRWFQVGLLDLAKQEDGCVPPLPRSCRAQG